MVYVKELLNQAVSCLYTAENELISSGRATSEAKEDLNNAILSVETAMDTIFSL